MFVCTICHKKFTTEEELVKHFLPCWKDKNPSHKSTDAHKSEDIEQRNINNDMINFFKMINGEAK